MSKLKDFTLMTAQRRLAQLSGNMIMPQTKDFDVDVVIVGAGFSGISTLHYLRDELNLNVKIIDSASDIGGTWYWNAYPGARVDCPVPTYAFDAEEIWKDWDWSEMYPSRAELGAYFAHVDRVWSIRKDCIFNTEVNGATFNGERWTLKTNNDTTIKAKYFIPAVGFASEQYIPPWKGMETFQGEIHHPWSWPREGVNVKGKRVAVIGTGSTGVQIIQEWTKEAAETFVFQRTPNIAIPMRPKKLDRQAQERIKEDTPDLFAACQTTPGGLPWGKHDKNFDDYSAEEIEEILSNLYYTGGFRYWSGGYGDLGTNPVANRAAYDFWAKKTRPRIKDPVKRDLLAPLEPPHPFGTKRPSLEQDYYEQMDKPNVHLVNTKAHPIVALTPNGIMTDDGTIYEVDAIALATGYNASTGSLNRMGIKDVNGVNISERWKNGVSTFLGMMVPGFPNMFFPYGVQAPTPFTNGPRFIAFQASYIRDVVKKMEANEVRSLEPNPKAAEAWTGLIHAIANMTLVSKADSWYMGSNIPGKPRECLYFLGGIPAYCNLCHEALDSKFEDSFICS
ncbi:uncharacterized protein N7483_005978 [Penicillium malachiteum]|uniref:uncharacterized protein n=1 Tax=Penicillium malachiteum TaxID=1324776 RepID=UPI0025481651|nr:uncharacterized protein N7483_005978 [Penicillium malachiteum]KAJ5731470.1 hypothetical protein N7483_005978 [Penicillium malachiteum]